MNLPPIEIIGLKTDAFREEVSHLDREGAKKLKARLGEEMEKLKFSIDDDELTDLRGPEWVRRAKAALGFMRQKDQIINGHLAGLREDKKEEAKGNAFLLVCWSKERGYHWVATQEHPAEWATDMLEGISEEEERAGQMPFILWSTQIAPSQIARVPEKFFQ